GRICDTDIGARGSGLGLPAVARSAKVGSLDQLEQDWRRDVVRKVTGDPNGTWLKDSGQVQRQKVSDDDLDVRRELRFERGREVTIDFDGGQVRDAGGQPERQRPGPGADLQKTIPGLGSDCLHELVSP